MRTSLLLSASALALGLSACTVNVRPNTGLSGSGNNLIADLRPDRGEGSTYAIGEQVRIRVTTRTPGYLTLIALQSNGAASTLVRNMPVQAGTNVFPRPQDGVTFSVGAPRGVQHVRAIFTRVRPTTDLVLRGTYDNGQWNAVSEQYVSPYAAADRDVQETYFYIR